MGNVIVVGAQWGDEGKGKVVDWLSERADVIVRFQGGHNAGHTLVIDGQKYILSLLPSGILRKGKLSVIGNGVVIDPFALIAEIEKIRAQGAEITPDNLQIAENACLILPVHKMMDTASEQMRGETKIGTTGRGIGPAYEDKAARRAIRICDLMNDEILKSKIDALVSHHNRVRTGYNLDPVDAGEILAEINKIKAEILKYAAPVWLTLDKARKAGKKVLFEGAQGAMLDVDFGTYPYVTSSNTVPGQASTGSGMGVGSVGYVLGIAKAYTTRVGSGPFPSELFDDTGKFIAEKGHEFGSVTGRPRRCGWFDAVMVRQASKICGINGIVLTKLDVLDGIKTLNICVGYKIGGKHYDYLPAGIWDNQSIEPIYEEIDGWSESTFGAQRYADLPANAIKYIKRIEELTETPITMLSTSPKREDTILMQDPFL